MSKKGAFIKNIFILYECANDYKNKNIFFFITENELGSECENKILDW